MCEQGLPERLGEQDLPAQVGERDLPEQMGEQDLPEQNVRTSRLLHEMSFTLPQILDFDHCLVSY